MTANVLRERLAEGIEVLRLNRPAKRNALDTATLTQLLAALDHLAADTGLRALIISTTDMQALCAGADVSEALDTAGGIERMALFCRLYAAIEAFPAPTIAVCVGNCVGAGAEIAAGCDLRVGGDNLKLAWAGARLGVPVGPARLAQLIGVSRAKELLFTGRVVGTAEALEIGFMHRTSPVQRAESDAIELAGAIAAQSVDGLRVIKQMFRDLDGTSERVAHENELLMQFQRHGSGIPTSR
ncbi:MAG TPA: enoyl-CoA hydratase/isomerase family protein [Jatrophihabitantaceae bacterium]|jgi:enoyl-CoA hydratase/carnithine racemase|nr:enoyl-CoA hydratase/isomerase family protein [Jatrophihabitantaceae bacterium]